ncbi:MAG: hypothetical protein K9L30_05335 [Desulfobacterales bacterium]|nr:hypothetical protein [Desulfobacterales bacterium]
MSYYDFAPYVRVAERRANAEKKIKQLKKKNPDIKPVIIEGRALANTWWGKSWNENLERYADYSNRIGRGRSYVRHMAVLDLQINAGEVNALVQGSRSKPYSISVKIKKIKKDIRRNMKDICKGEIDSLPELLAGKFPKKLGEIFMKKGSGLFPSPSEIAFICSCPDWAYMCKHVAAVLYGIGARLDEDPALFFMLRGMDMKDLVSTAVKDHSRRLLEKAEQTGAKVIDNSDLSDMFGIDMEDDIRFDLPVVSVIKTGGKKKKIKTAEQSAQKVSAKQKRPVKSAKAPVPVKTKRKKKETGNKAVPDPVTQVIGVVRRSRKGVDVATIQVKTGIDVQKIRNIVYKAIKEGKIMRIARGVYLKAKS